MGQLASVFPTGKEQRKKMHIKAVGGIPTARTNGKKKPRVIDGFLCGYTYLIWQNLDATSLRSTFPTFLLQKNSIPIQAVLHSLPVGIYFILNIHTCCQDFQVQHPKSLSKPVNLSSPPLPLHVPGPLHAAGPLKQTPDWCLTSTNLPSTPSLRDCTAPNIASH